LNAAFAMAILDLISHVHLPTTLLQIINCCVFDFLTLYLYVTHTTSMPQLKIKMSLFHCFKGDIKETKFTKLVKDAGKKVMIFC
jgi:hypothetical protein